LKLILAYGDKGKNYKYIFEKVRAGGGGLIFRTKIKTPCITLFKMVIPILKPDEAEIELFVFGS
jgi:hypothetical protein